MLLCQNDSILSIYPRERNEWATHTHLKHHKHKTPAKCKAALFIKDNNYKYLPYIQWLRSNASSSLRSTLVRETDPTQAKTMGSYATTKDPRATKTGKQILITDICRW